MEVRFSCEQQWPVLDVPPAAVACAVLSPRFLPAPTGRRTPGHIHGLHSLKFGIMGCWGVSCAVSGYFIPPVCGVRPLVAPLKCGGGLVGAGWLGRWPCTRLLTLPGCVGSLASTLQLAICGWILDLLKTFSGISICSQSLLSFIMHYWYLYCFLTNKLDV